MRQKLLDSLRDQHQVRRQQLRQLWGQVPHLLLHFSNMLMGICGSTCNPGFKDCDYNKLNGCEVNCNSDVKNCGNCGVKCPTYPYSTSSCSNAKCTAACVPGWKDCNSNWIDGCETDTGKDVNNCGSCGMKCPTYPYSTTTSCSNGKCKPVCVPGWNDCNANWKDGCETDTGKDVNNCGSCGMKCPTDPYSTTSCSNGECTPKCVSGWADCNANWKDGCETDTGKDINNCGGCGKNCPCMDSNALPTCSKGMCGVQCKSGWTYNSSQKKCVKVY